MCILCICMYGILLFFIFFFFLIILNLLVPSSFLSAPGMFYVLIFRLSSYGIFPEQNWPSYLVFLQLARLYSWQKDDCEYLRSSR